MVHYQASLPNLICRTIMLAAWHQPYWEWLHRKNQNITQITGPHPLQQNKLLTFLSIPVGLTHPQWSEFHRAVKQLYNLSLLHRGYSSWKQWLVQERSCDPNRTNQRSLERGQIWMLPEESSFSLWDHKLKGSCYPGVAGDLHVEEGCQKPTKKKLEKRKRTFVMSFEHLDPPIPETGTNSWNFQIFKRNKLWGLKKVLSHVSVSCNWDSSDLSTLLGRIQVDPWALI